MGGGVLLWGGGDNNNWEKMEVSTISRNCKGVQINLGSLKKPEQ